MPDTVTRTTTTSYGQRVVKSFQGVVGGVILACGALGLLYWNEGRVDLSDIAKKSEEIPALTSNAAGDGTFVSTTGEVTIADTLGDGEYLVAGPYLALERRVEMYAWVEEKKEESTTNADGSETTTTTYSYTKEWVTDPESSSAFEEPTGHENPSSFDVAKKSFRVPVLRVGEFSVPAKGLVLPAPTSLTLNPGNLTAKGKVAQAGDYLFFGVGTLSAPQIGDERVSYEALSPDFSGTVFGTRKGGEIRSFTDGDGNTVFRLFEGDRAGALAALHGEYLMMLWFLRILGFILLWAGLQALLGPFAIIADRFPLLGSFAKAGVGFVTFVVALVVSVVTIILSAIIHSWIALLIVLLLLVGGALWARRKAAAATPTPAGAR